MRRHPIIGMPFPLSIGLIAASGLMAAGQSNAFSSGLSDEEIQARRAAFRLTTPQYRSEALDAMIGEANRVAADLNLPESRPITRSNVVEAIIDRPIDAYPGILGVLSTSNYSYTFTHHRKFSALYPAHYGKEFTEMKMKYIWPKNRLDTNNALRTAMRLMKQVGMDVDALNRDCVPEVSVVWPDGEHGKRFVPDYWVRWKKSGEKVALVEFLEPTMSIGELHVNDSKYILRPAVEVPHLRELLISNITSRAILQQLGLPYTNATGVSDLGTNTIQTNAAVKP